MRFQCALLDEALRADRTLVRLFARVRHDVVFERFRLPEATLTVWALKVLYPAVHNLQVSRIIACGEGG